MDPGHTPHTTAPAGPVPAEQLFDEWWAKHFSDVEDDETAFDRGEMSEAFAAGAAAQRFVLVWRDECGGEICRSAALTAGQTRIGIPLEAFCADLVAAVRGAAEGGTGVS